MNKIKKNKESKKLYALLIWLNYVLKDFSIVYQTNWVYTV